MSIGARRQLEESPVPDYVYEELTELGPESHLRLVEATESHAVLARTGIADEVAGVIALGATMEVENNRYGEWDDPEKLETDDIFLGETVGRLDFDIKDWSKRGKRPLLSREEEATLAKKIETGDLEARRVFIESNLGLVIKMASTKAGRDRQKLDDLIQEGFIGLIRAVDKFDFRLGNKFSVYAKWWIRQTMDRSIPTTGYTIGIPVHVYEAMPELLRNTDRLRGELGREPKDQEVAQAIMQERTQKKLEKNKTDSGVKVITPERVGELREVAGNKIKVDSLNRRKRGFDSELGNEIGELIPADVAVDGQAIDAIMTSELLDVLNVLSGIERKILESSFGLRPEGERTVAEIAKELGIRKVDVEEIRDSALEILSQTKGAEKLREYIS